MTDFLFCFDYRVGVADINYGGHVSNATVLNIFQDARIAYLQELGSFSELDLGGCGLIMPEAHVYYRQEMFLGDKLKVWVRAAEIKRSTFTLSYRIEREQVVTAEGETKLACFNYQSHKPTRIPQIFLEAVTRFEGLAR